MAGEESDAHAQRTKGQMPTTLRSCQFVAPASDPLCVERPSLAAYGSPGAVGVGVGDPPLRQRTSGSGSDSARRAVGTAGADSAAVGVGPGVGVGGAIGAVYARRVKDQMPARGRHSTRCPRQYDLGFHLSGCLKTAPRENCSS